MLLSLLPWSMFAIAIGLGLIWGSANWTGRRAKLRKGISFLIYLVFKDFVGKKEKFWVHYTVKNVTVKMFGIHQTIDRKFRCLAGLFFSPDVFYCLLWEKLYKLEKLLLKLVLWKSYSRWSSKKVTCLENVAYLISGSIATSPRPDTVARSTKYLI